MRKNKSNNRPLDQARLIWGAPGQQLGLGSAAELRGLFSMAYQPGSRRSCPLSFSHWRARVRTYLPLVTLRVTSVMTS